mgnify:CR=1 FL=1
MANGLLERKNLEDIAAAIRVKNGQTEVKYKPSQMADAIMEIKTGGSIIVSNEVSEVHIVDGKTTINVPKTEKEPEVGDYIVAQTKNGNDYDAAVFKIDAVDKDTDADNYICSVTVSDTLDVIGVDSSDATALATDIMKGKTAYVNNEKVTGTLEALVGKDLEVKSVTKGVGDAGPGGSTVTYSDINVTFTNDLTASQVINSTTRTIETSIDYSDIATAIDLKAGDIVTGKTVLGIAGAGGAAGGIDTTDANATADNIESGKTAYVNGAKITGTLSLLSGKVASDTTTATINTAKDGLTIELGKTTKSILAANSSLKSDVSFTDINTALTAGGVGVNATDIAQGKTILGVTGTFTSDANAIAGNLVKDKTAYVNGVKITGTMEEVTGTTGKLINKTTTETDKLVFTPENNGYIETSSELHILNTDLVTTLGLTADKIAKGTTILGVEGTFEATTEKEDKITELTNKVAELQAIIDGYEDLNEVQF